MKLPAQLPILLTQLSTKSPQPLYQQLYAQIKNCIFSGKLLPGARLPSSRTVARTLKISRNTALLAYEQLFAEGYLVARIGDGTRVSATLPDEYLELRLPTPLSLKREVTPLNRDALLNNAQKLKGGAWKTWKGVKPFRTGVPPYDIFPMKLWCRLMSDAYRNARKAQLAYGDGMGYFQLRSAIARHLAPARGISCKEENIIIVPSSHNGIDLLVRCFSSPGERAYLENPGYPGARYLFELAGVKCHPLIIDGQGARPVAHPKKSSLVFVTPSHQFPTGIVMSLERRMQLLTWCEKNSLLIIEDDYSGEYRYQEHPIPALKALDTHGLVYHLGTFSKVSFPAMRIGYIVVPDHRQAEFEHLFSLLECSVPTPTQMALARFIEEGHYLRHLRKVRKLAFQRKQALVEVLNQHLPEGSSFLDSDAGMHILLKLPRSINDQNLCKVLLDQGIQTLPLSECFQGKAENGLILHYAGFPEAALKDSAIRLCAALAKQSKS